MHAESAECANIADVPRWKEDEDRGEFGAWLSAQVGDRTFDWLALEMAARGHTHGASYYRAMASGAKPPGRAIRRALREYFGAGPEIPRAEPTQDPVAAAIDRQTEVLRQLLDETRLGRVAQETVAAAIGELAGMVEERLPRGDRRAGREPLGVGGSQQ